MEMREEMERRKRRKVQVKGNKGMVALEEVRGKHGREQRE